MVSSWDDNVTLDMRAGVCRRIEVEGPSLAELRVGLELSPRTDVFADVKS